MSNNKPDDIKERPPKPQDGRLYIWLSNLNCWFDISPKERNLVTFIRVEKKG